MGEAEHPVSGYKTIEDIFTRALKPGSRALEKEPLSPADGMLSVSRAVVDGMAVQAKGINYSVEELVFGAINTGRAFKPSWFSTVYLAPHNYHRVHTPVSGKIVSMRYIPGELWPVNKPAVSFVPKLFCRNERLVFTVDTGKGNVHAVMVGALNVARMTTRFWPELTTHDAIKALPGKMIEKNNLSHEITAGDELGTFMLGSTVVVVYEEETVNSDEMMSVDQTQKIVMGKTLTK